jgi:hypothetical protein
MGIEGEGATKGRRCKRMGTGVWAAAGGGEKKEERMDEESLLLNVSHRPSIRTQLNDKIKTSGVSGKVEQVSSLPTPLF